MDFQYYQQQIPQLVVLDSIKKMVYITRSKIWRITRPRFAICQKLAASGIIRV